MQQAQKQNRILKGGTNNLTCLKIQRLPKAKLYKHIKT